MTVEDDDPGLCRHRPDAVDRAGVKGFASCQAVEGLGPTGPSRLEGRAGHSPTYSGRAVPCGQGCPCGAPDRFYRWQAFEPGCL